MAVRPTPPQARLMVRVGVVGHRPNKLAATDEPALRARIREALQAICRLATDIEQAGQCPYQDAPPVFRLVSSLAEGADRLAAEEALGLGLELETALPFAREGYERDFALPESQERFRDLLRRSHSVFEWNGSRANESEAYEAAAMLVLHHCDILLAIWNGGTADGRGGTAETVLEAQRLEVPTLWIRSQPPHSIALLADGEEQAAADWTFVLKEVITRLLALPGESRSDACWAYFSERRPAFTLGGFYKLAFAILLGRKPRPWRFRVPGFIEQVRPEWDSLWSGAPNSCQPARKQIQDSFLEHYAWADQLADLYASLHRSSFLVNYLMGAMAVAFALFSYAVSGWERPFVTAELLLIVLIIANTFFSTRRRLHDRWIDYRLLAEQIRHMRFLTPLGRTTPAVLVPPQHAYADPRHTWVNWHFRAIVREAGLLDVRLDAASLAAFRDLVAHEIRSQIQYHAGNAESAGRIRHRLHSISTGCFIATLIACSAHFILHGDMARWLTAASAIFPSIAAALAGISSQGEFGRILKRSDATRRSLEKLVEKLDTQSPLDAKAIGAVAESAAEAMIAEVLDWRVMFQTRPLGLPA